MDFASVLRWGVVGSSVVRWFGGGGFNLFVDFAAAVVVAVVEVLVLSWTDKKSAR